MWNEQLKFQVWNVRGHWSAESRLALMGSKERKQPQRWYLLFCSDTAVIEQAHKKWCFFQQHRMENPGPGSGCFPRMQKQEVAVGHIYILYDEEWWKNILGGGEQERRWVSRFSNSANVKVIADSLLDTERKHNKSIKSLCVREYAILQFSSHGLYSQMELMFFPPFYYW